jgi:protein involved in plasmid replication-relaxation
MKPTLPPVTVRDRELFDRLSQHEPLSTSELHLLFFSGLRTCRRRLSRLEDAGLLMRVFPTRSIRGGNTEALWFLSPGGRRVIGAPARRLPGLSIPDLEHRRAVAAFFLTLVESSLTRPGEGLYSWLGEQQAQQGTGAGVRPDGYGRYLLPEGEIAFYLELDRGSEPNGRIRSKLDAYRQALAGDPHREQGNVLLVCQGPRRLANLARCAPPGPPWVWGTVEGEQYTLLPGQDQQRSFCELPAGPRQPVRPAADCLGRRWRNATLAASTRGPAT